jgi:diguanylate cyclase (GGDEF)-like protein
MRSSINFAALFENSPNCYVLVSPDLTIVAANAAYRKATSSSEGLVEKRWSDVYPEDPDDPNYASRLNVRDSLLRVAATGTPDTIALVRYQVLMTAASGRVTEDRYWNVSHTPIIDPNTGKVQFVLQHTVDVTDIQRLSQDQLKQIIKERLRAIEEGEHERRRALYLSQHDGLTGLPNRTMFQAKLETALENAEKNATQVTVLFLDVDHFKEVNESLGHYVGDMLLKGIALKLKECVGPKELVARLGGDEFGVISTQGDDPDVLAGKLVDALSQPIALQTQKISTSVSVGITCYPHHALTSTQLMMNADMAMYLAKRNGRSRYAHYTEDLDTEAKRRHAILDALQTALINDSLQLNYQPVVSIASGTICSAEALLRLSIDTIPLLTAAELVQVAEESGQIMELGKWILKKACVQAKQWQPYAPRSLRIAVNISAQQLRDPGFVDLVDEILAFSGLDPDCLELEITERMLMEKNRVNMMTLKALKQKGIRIAVDDFGTGFSSLGYLKHFPVDILKIDKIFIKGLPDDPQDAAITSAIINMAHDLGLKVIAEGIETPAQLAQLRQLGCDIGQGYIFSDALSVQEFTEKLLANQWVRVNCTGS